MTGSATQIVSEIFYASLDAVSPYASVKQYCRSIESLWETGAFRSLHVIGFGKASCQMAKAVEDMLPVPIDGGCVITKYGHCIDRPLKIKVYEAGHPLPDDRGIDGTDAVIRHLRGADQTTLLVCLISGGGSALLVSPCEGISLREKQIVTDLLLKCGADIYEVNTVRKHLSRVKGGRLAEAACPARVISLILSDVMGNDIGVIASGPTAPDATTYGDAMSVLERHALLDKVPGSVLRVLHDGCRGVLPDTPKEGNAIFEKVENIVIASNSSALEAAKEKASDLGYYSEIVSSRVTGEARDAGRWLAGVALGLRDNPGRLPNKRVCLISGGETTVTVRGHGRGGRNMELALSFAMEVEGVEGITLLSAGTDGNDGPTNAAGAVVDGKTIGKARAAGLDPERYLERNDSYDFFSQIDGLFITGPTGTNVMDMQLVVLE